MWPLELSHGMYDSSTHVAVNIHCVETDNHRISVIALSLIRNTIYRSENIQNHLNPFWEPFSIDLEELCYCNLEWPLKISVFDWEASGKHRRIGEFEVTTQKLMERVAIKGNADREQAFDLMLDEKAQLKGLVCVLTAELALLEEDHQ
jgi:Ca2+-dependent lipid-binding protein